MRTKLRFASRSADDRLDRVFHALSDRTRRRMLARLAYGAATVSELAEPFDMTLPGVSKHLRVMQRAGLIRMTVHGRSRRCTLNRKPLDQIMNWLGEHRAMWEDALESLAAAVEEEE